MSKTAPLPTIVESEDTVILTGRGEESKSELLGDFPVEYGNPAYPESAAPDSIVSKAPDEFVKNLYLSDVWELLEKNDEYELRKKVKPSAEHNRLRMGFWREYERALQTGEDMDPVNIYKGIMPKENFDFLLKSRPRTIAWILKQPTNYVNMMEEALQFSMHRVREILEMPLYKMETREVPQPSGKTKTMQKRVPNVQVAKLILDTMKLLDVRVKGAIVSRVQQHVTSESKSLHVNVDVPNGNDTKSLSDIDAQIAKLSKGLNVKK